LRPIPIPASLHLLPFDHIYHNCHIFPITCPINSVFIFVLYPRPCFLCCVHEEAHALPTLMRGTRVTGLPQRVNHTMTLPLCPLFLPLLYSIPTVPSSQPFYDQLYLEIHPNFLYYQKPIKVSRLGDPPQLQ